MYVRVVNCMQMNKSTYSYIIITRANETMAEENDEFIVSDKEV